MNRIRSIFFLSDDKVRWPKVITQVEIDPNDENKRWILQNPKKADSRLFAPFPGFWLINLMKKHCFKLYFSPKMFFNLDDSRLWSKELLSITYQYQSLRQIFAFWGLITMHTNVTAFPGFFVDNKKSWSENGALRGILLTLNSRFLRERRSKRQSQCEIETFVHAAIFQRVSCEECSLTGDASHSQIMRQSVCSEKDLFMRHSHGIFFASKYFEVVCEGENEFFYTHHD